MDDFLTAVKTSRNHVDREPEPALTIRSSQRTEPKSPEPHQQVQLESRHSFIATQTVGNDLPGAPCDTPERALQLLRSQPDADSLLATLRALSSKGGLGETFTLALPGPLQAQIINTIVSTILPSFWAAFEGKDRAILLACLTNTTGFNAVLARLRLLAADAQQSKGGHLAQIEILLDTAEHLFHGNDIILQICTGLYQNQDGATTVKCDLAWKEAVTLFASGKVTGFVAQAEDALFAGEDKVRSKSSWLAKSPEYNAWLGRNIATLAQVDGSEASLSAPEAAVPVLDKALSTRSHATLMKGLFPVLLERDGQSRTYEEFSRSFGRLSRGLLAFRKRQFAEQILHWLSHLMSREDSIEQKDTAGLKETSAASALAKSIIHGDEDFGKFFCGVLTDSMQAAALPLNVRRATVAAFKAAASNELEPVLEELMSTFSDAIFIDHAPVVQQEAIAQNLLLVAGYLHRQAPMAVLVTARSSSHMQGVSRRLDSSNARARWLGMVVGMAVSSLVDKEGSKMDFSVDEVQTSEAVWYMSLAKTEDGIGNLDDLRELVHSQEKPRKPFKGRQATKQETMPTIDGKPTFGPLRPPAPAQTEVLGERVTELVDDDSDEEDDELKPYAKPDSDPEDSDEDATLVNRNKPRAPVYVRDLMRMLQDDQNADRFQLGITHAAALIRRKAAFGSEVQDHAQELLSIFCSLQDPFDTENFDELRMQAVIALVLCDVQTLGPWLSRHVFAGDYSIAQRCLMLTALGLSGRELAGFKHEDDFNPALPNTDFASKRLPPRLHAMWTGARQPTKQLDSAYKNVEHQLIQPMALQAADQSTAHLNAVKVRNFSSRLSADNRTKRKPAPNQLAKIFGSAFFFPLVGRYQQDISAYGPGSIFTSAPFVLVTFLKTLALLLNASGPATLALPHVTAEYWDLLLSLRVQASGDISVLQAVLFSFLTLLEVNQDQLRLAQDQPKQLMETQQWVEVVFEKVGGGEMVTGGSEEETKVRTLAAGVLVKTREVVEIYQRQLFGQVVE